MLLAATGKTQTELCEMLGYSRVNLFKKLTRGTLSDEELEKIAKYCGAVYVSGFRLPDGTEI